MYYEGDANNKITIEREMGYGAIKNIVICGNIIGNGTAITNLNYNTISNSPDLTVYATNVNNLSTIQHYELIINTIFKFKFNFNNNIDNLNSLSG
jgi:hypothetical protein